jgi:hypothetical protein
MLLKSDFSALKINYLDRLSLLLVRLGPIFIRTSAGGIRLWLSWLPVALLSMTCLIGA